MRDPKTGKKLDEFVLKNEQSSGIFFRDDYGEAVGRYLKGCLIQPCEGYDRNIADSVRSGDNKN